MMKKIIISSIFLCLGAFSAFGQTSVPGTGKRVIPAPFPPPVKTAINIAPSVSQTVTVPSRTIWKPGMPQILPAPGSPDFVKTKAIMSQSSATDKNVILPLRVSDMKIVGDKVMIDGRLYQKPATPPVSK